MKVKVKTLTDGVVEYEGVRDGWVEIPTRDGDPEYPARHRLEDIVSITVSGHAPPIVQTIEPVELERVTVSKAEAAAGKNAASLLALDPRFAEVAYSYQRPKLKTPAKKKAADA